MPRDFYSDEPTATDSETNPTPASESPSKTALIDAAIAPGLKPGDEITVKVEKVMDGEYLVSGEVESEADGEYSTPAAETESPTSQTSNIGSMME